MGRCALVLAGVLIPLTIGGAVQAADLPSPIPGNGSYYPQSINWTGPYVGAQFGGGFSHASWTDPFSGATDSPTGSNVLGGGQIGLNYQIGSWVFGVGADFDGTGIRGSATDAAGFTHTTKTQWLSTVTGRVGYAVDRSLFYAKGGAAFANERDGVVGPGGAASSGWLTRTGWAVGGGFEYAITRNWSALVEYDYMGFGGASNTLVGTPLGTSTGTVNLNLQKVIAGVDYRF